MDPTEPLRQTADALRPVLEELKQREPLFHRRELGTSAAEIRAQTHEQFWEVGASGSRYSREYVVQIRTQLWATEPEPWEGGDWSIGEFCCQELAPDVYLLTYDLTQGERHTRRATVWSRASGRWLVVYHQGTVVEDLAQA